MGYSLLNPRIPNYVQRACKCFAHQILLLNLHSAVVAAGFMFHFYMSRKAFKLVKAEEASKPVA